MTDLERMTEQACALADALEWLTRALTEDRKGLANSLESGDAYTPDALSGALENADYALRAWREACATDRVPPATSPPAPVCETWDRHNPARFNSLRLNDDPVRLAQRTEGILRFLISQKDSRAGVPIYTLAEQWFFCGCAAHERNSIIRNVMGRLAADGLVQQVDDTGARLGTTWLSVSTTLVERWALADLNAVLEQLHEDVET